MIVLPSVPSANWLSSMPRTSVKRSGSISMKTGICRERSRLSRSTLTSVTEPTRTPLKATGAPRFKPCTEPSKNNTNLLVSLKNRPLPKVMMAAAARTIAPTTKAPIAVVLAFLLMITQSSCRWSPSGRRQATPLSGRCGFRNRVEVGGTGLPGVCLKASICAILPSWFQVFMMVNCGKTAF